MSTLWALSEEEVVVIFVLDMFMREKSVLEGLMVWTQDVGWVVPLLDNFCVLSALHPMGQVCTLCCSPQHVPLIPACGLLPSCCRPGSILSVLYSVHSQLSCICRLGVVRTILPLARHSFL